MGWFQSTAKEAKVTEIEKGELTIFNEKYVVPPGKPMILYLKPLFWGHIYPGNTFKVADVNNSSSLVFQVDNSAVSNQDISIYDNKGEKVFFLSEDSFLKFGKKMIFGSNGEAFKISTNIIRMKQNTIGLVNKSDKTVKCRGNLNMMSMKGSIWYGEKENEVCIAKIINPTEAKQKVSPGVILDDSEDTYYVEIGPGVDSALVFSIILVAEWNYYLGAPLTRTF